MSAAGPSETGRTAATSSALRPFLELPGGLAPLGYRNFALYWVGHTVTNSGRWIELTGAVWLMSELTDSPVLLGLLGVARAVPSIIIGPLGGVLADRVDQRRLLVATQAFGVVASLLLGSLVLTGLIQFWHIYIQVALQASIEGVDVSVRQALFPRLVPRPRLADAVMLSATAARTAMLIGPAIGGIAIAGIGLAAPFLLRAATFPFLTAAVLWMRGIVPRTATTGSSIRGELIEGLRHIMTAPPLGALFKFAVAFGIFNMNPVTITIIGRQVLEVGPEGLGRLLTAPAVGSLIAIGVMLVMGQTERQGRFVILCTLAYCASLIAFAASTDQVWSFITLAVIGFFDILVSVTLFGVMQQVSPNRMRGRVMGNAAAVDRTVRPLAQTQSGILAGAIGGPLAVISAAAALAITAAIIARADPVLWRSRSDVTPRHDPPRPGEVGSRSTPPSGLGSEVADSERDV